MVQRSEVEKQKVLCFRTSVFCTFAVFVVRYRLRKMEFAATLKADSAISEKGVDHMGEVKSAFEKAMEKIKEIEGLTTEEKEELKDREKLKSLLADFYKGQLSRDQIWERFRGIRPSLLRDAQQNMADSLRLGNMPEEFQRRKDGMLAIEAVKEKKNTSAIEDTMSSMGKLQKEYRDGKERAVKELRAAIEADPQLRMRQVRTPDGRIVQTALPVEEAIQVRMGEFLAEHEKRYEMMFIQAIVRLKKELK
jgi:hypothetical protein